MKYIRLLLRKVKTKRLWPNEIEEAYRQYLLHYLWEVPSCHSVQGWSSTIITILFLGGIQLFTIGILGEYIGNIFDETKNRPEYIIQEKINFEE